MKEYKVPNYISASKNIRILHFLIDILLIKLSINLLFLLIDISIPRYQLLTWYNALDVYEMYLFSTVMIFLYYFLTELFFQRSLAKFITNTIVVMEDGTKPKTKDILARSVLRIIPFEYFSFLRGRKPGIHDDYSNTFVVHKNKLAQSIREYHELHDLN